MYSWLTEAMRGRQMRILLSTAWWLRLPNTASPFSMDAPGIGGQSFTTTLPETTPNCYSVTTNLDSYNTWPLAASQYPRSLVCMVAISESNKWSISAESTSDDSQYIGC